MGAFVTSNAETPMMLLLYGLPGSGKSYSVATYTKGSILLVQTEPGFISALKDPTFKAAVAAGTHTIYSATSWADVDAWRFNGGFEKWIAQNKLPMPSLIVVDSMTWLMEFAKEEVMKAYPSTSDKRRPEDRIPERMHYMMLQELVKQILVQFRKLPCDKILIAQAEVKELQEPGSTVTIWFPSISGKYTTRTGHDVDAVLFTKRDGKGQFIAETRTTSTHLGKVRGLEVGSEIPLNLDRIVELWAKVRE